MFYGINLLSILDLKQLRKLNCFSFDILFDWPCLVKTPEELEMLSNGEERMKTTCKSVKTSESFFSLQTCAGIGMETFVGCGRTNLDNFVLK